MSIKRAILAVGILATVGAQAATINWTVDEFDALADISTNGTLVSAINWGGATTGTINGVDFIPKPDDGSNLSISNWTTLVDNDLDNNNVFTGASGNWDSGEATAVENSGVMDTAIQEVSHSPDETKVTLSGLTTGLTYQVQLFIIDDGRSIHNGGIPTVDYLASPYLLGSSTEQGTVFTGLFTADAEDQDFDLSYVFQSSNTLFQLNASQLRVVDAADLPVTLTYLATDDTYADEADVGTAFGTIDQIRLRNNAAQNRHGYLKFNVDYAPDIQKVTVRVKPTSNGLGGLTIHEVSDTSWSENTLTWSNKPSIGPAINSASGVNGDVWMEIDVTSYVTNSGTYSFGIIRNTVTGNQRSIYSKEAAGGENGPLLVVEFVDATNNAPSFTSDPIIKPDATEIVAYSADLSGDAVDVDGDPLTFAKEDGPAWLDVWDSGFISGNPTTNDLGTNIFLVSVMDDKGKSDLATLNIVVNELSGDLTATTNTFGVTDDVHTDQEFPTNNYGSAINVQLRTNPSGTNSRNAFIKFDVDNVENVTGATLRLKPVNNLNQTVSIYAVSDTSWSETNVTWNTAPVLGDLITVETGDNINWIEFDVGSYVTTAGTYAFGIVRGQETSQRAFSSQDGPNPPELVISYLSDGPTSVGDVAVAGVDESGNLITSFIGEAGGTYAQQRTLDLVSPDWSNVVENITGVGEINVTNDTTEAQAFYRVILQ